MPLFWKPYKSDVTLFIEQLKAKKPTLEDEQRAGRALLWDRRIDREAQAESATPACRSSPTSTRPRPSDPPVASPRRRRADLRAERAAPAARRGRRRWRVARLYGEPLFAMPTDLYIPPDALEVFLEAFEGPLDLLLYLIRKQNFNILDIPLAERDAPVPGLRRADPQAQPRARQRIPADGGDADRDQVAHAAAAEEERRRRGGRGPARRAGAPAARVRADEARRRAARRAAAARAATSCARRSRSSSRSRRAFPTSTPTTCATPGPTSSSAPS